MPNKHSGFFKNNNVTLASAICDLSSSNDENIEYAFNMLNSCTDDFYKKCIIEDLTKYLAIDYLISLYVDNLDNILSD